MATYRGSLKCVGTSIGAQRHICAFFNSLDDEHRVLGSFYKDGFDRGEKATDIVDAEHREEYLKRLAEAGIDVQRTMDTRLSLLAAYCVKTRSLFPVSR
jgi:hypothetical protein